MIGAGLRRPDVPQVGLDARAVASSGGSSVLRTASREARLACAETLTAATTAPSRPRTGAATERRPSSSSWSTSAQPWARIVASSAVSAAGSVIVRDVSGRSSARAR